MPANAPTRSRVRQVRRTREWRGPFRHRNYRLFWSGQLISLAGTWMQSIAQAWLITELTPDPVWLGIVAAAQRFLHRSSLLALGFSLRGRAFLAWAGIGLALKVAATAIACWHLRP